jgi:hypothetical protein
MSETRDEDANIPERPPPPESVDPDAPARGVLDDEEAPEPNEPA